jgi:hypothetical protein
MSVNRLPKSQPTMRLKTVAELVPTPDMDPRPQTVHQVDVMFEQIADQAERVASVIGAIAVYQDVDICFNIGKHPPHDVALALHLLMADDRARGPSDRDSAIF